MEGVATQTMGGLSDGLSQVFDLIVGFVESVISILFPFVDDVSEAESFCFRVVLAMYSWYLLLFFGISMVNLVGVYRQLGQPNGGSDLKAPRANHRKEGCLVWALMLVPRFIWNAISFVLHADCWVTPAEEELSDVEGDCCVIPGEEDLSDVEDLPNSQRPGGRRSRPGRADPAAMEEGRFVPQGSFWFL